MGLDLVEVVMDVEETFGVSLGDAQLAEVRTVGDLRDYVIEILNRDNEDVAGLTNDVYENLCKGLNSLGIASGDVIRPDSRLSEMLPSFGRRIAWRRLERTTGLPLPPLQRSHLVSTIVTVLAIPIGWILGFSLLFALMPPQTFQHSSSFAWLVAVVGLVLGFFAIFLVWIVGRVLTFPLASHWPSSIQTTGDLSRAVCEKHYGKLVNQHQGFNRDEVWIILQLIVSRGLGVDRTIVTPEARFVEDLGAG